MPRRLASGYRRIRTPKPARVLFLWPESGEWHTYGFGDAVSKAGNVVRNVHDWAVLTSGGR